MTEVRCAGLEHQYIDQEYESIQERFLNNYEPDDYGND